MTDKFTSSQFGGTANFNKNHQQSEGDKYDEYKKEHRVLPRDLGWRLVLQQGDPHPSGRGAQGDDIALAAHESEANQKALQALDSGAGLDYRIVEGG